MRPWIVASALATLMCFTSTCYFFAIPEEIKKSPTSRAGYWGQPDAEFNWCELDYQLVDWIAEPVNTASCLVMVALPLMFLATHEATLDNTVIGWLEVAIAVGSILFHATLRYPMQLADEIPMLWYVAAVDSSCLWRLRDIDVSYLTTGWVAVVTGTILVTEQHSFIHEIFRGLMTLSFSTGLVVIGWGASALVARIKREVSDKQRRAAAAAEGILYCALLMFALSVVSWLLDNYFCSALRNLPGGLPYPQLHTWWHVLIAMTLHCIMLLLHLDSRRHSSSLEVDYVAGFFPMIRG
ncbi:ACER3 [Symbiodinium sp. CCMP2592]|nr:ACER3 [Symbiodinium sp. CCMP2592]